MCSEEAIPPFGAAGSGSETDFVFGGGGLIGSARSDFLAICHGVVWWGGHPPSFVPTSAVVPRSVRPSVPPFAHGSQGISAISNLSPFRGSRFV